MLFTAVVGALLFIESGVFNVAASVPHGYVTYWIAETTMVHSVKMRARHIKAPRQFDADQARSGFCSYETHCVGCHGAPAVAQQHWADGLMPPPPYLIAASRRWSAAELFWIIRNGVKMTAMTSWGFSLPDDEIWNLVAFLEEIPTWEPHRYERMRAAKLCREPPIWQPSGKQYWPG